MKYSLIIAAFVVFTGLVTSCGSLSVIVQGGGSGTTSLPTSHYSSFRSLGIEPGHLPPPGSCKIWYPNEPAGQQPPPTSCENAMRDAPLNSWVLYRDETDPDILVVKEILASRPIQIKVSHYTINK